MKQRNCSVDHQTWACLHLLWNYGLEAFIRSMTPWRMTWYDGNERTRTYFILNFVIQVWDSSL